MGQFTLAFANIKPGERSLPGAVGCWGRGLVGCSATALLSPPCRLPPHPPPLQGRHQHPALLALRPHPHHRAARPRAGLTHGAYGIGIEAIGPARFWPHRAGAMGLSTPPPRRSVCVVPVSSSLLCPCLQWPLGAGDRHWCLQRWFGISPTWQGSATGRRRAGARRPGSAGGWSPSPPRGSEAGAKQTPGLGRAGRGAAAHCPHPAAPSEPPAPTAPGMLLASTTLLTLAVSSRCKHPNKVFSGRQARVWVRWCCSGFRGHSAPASILRRGFQVQHKPQGLLLA